MGPWAGVFLLMLARAAEGSDGGGAGLPLFLGGDAASLQTGQQVDVGGAGAPRVVLVRHTLSGLVCIINALFLLFFTWDSSPAL